MQYCPYRRRVSHAALALLVVAALSRCSWEESRELGQRSKILAQHRAGHPTPLQTPTHDCDRESGCMCRGATVVQPVNAAHVADLKGEWLPIDPAAVTVGLKLAATDCRGPALEEMVYLQRVSGRQLRALYVSLLI